MKNIVAVYISSIVSIVLFTWLIQMNISIPEIFICSSIITAFIFLMSKLSK